MTMEPGRPGRERPGAERPDLEGHREGHIEWRALVIRQARACGSDLSPSMVAELAAHLEDLYLTAVEDGASQVEALQAAEDALRRSPLDVLAAEIRRQARDSRVRSSDDLARAHERRSLAMLYAVRIALRQFRTQPLFALLTVLVLGLGTGAAVTVYTVVDAVVLRPLPYRAPDRLVALWDSNAAKGLPHEPIAPVTFMDYRGLHSFSDAAAWWRPDVNLADPGLDPIRVKTVETSANLFAVLGVGPQLGGGFPQDGHLFSNDLAVVISAKLWRTRYGADRSMVGRQLKLNGSAFTVLGVMPDGFDYPGDIDVWERLSWDMAQHVREAHFMEAVARLRPGVDLTEARQEGIALAGRLGRQFADSNGGWAYQFVPLLDDQLGYYRPALLVMFGAVGLLLVIGCLNVASLLLARALARDREVAVRVALGATRRQIVTQLLAESLVLSVAGIGAGLAFSAVALPIIVALTPVTIPRLSEAAISGRVLVFAMGVAATTTIGFGLVPGLVLLRRQLGSHLREGDRGTSRGSQRLYQALVVGEVALACALLMGSALLVRTVRQMTQAPSGVAADHVLLASVQLSGASYREWQKVADTQAVLLERIRQQPGVFAAGATIRLPFETGWRTAFFMNDVKPAQDTDAPQAQIMSVSDGYFEAMGARLVSGRFFSPQDTSHTQGVAIVNEAFVRRYAGARAAIDQRVTTAGQIGPLGVSLTAITLPDGYLKPQPAQIVGVVGDIPNAALGQPVEPTIYSPATQFPFRSMFFAVSSRDATTAATAVRRALHDVSPITPVGPTETWADRFGKRTAEPRVLMATLSAFGVLAAILASLGVYGLFSWSVASRRRELAIRLTLGARPARIGALILEQGVLLVTIGLAGGWLIVYAARGPLATLLFQVSPNDPASTMMAAGLLMAASLAACLPAARRAMRVNPVEGLRSE
jgi:putative ABC transport system permease protein